MERQTVLVTNQTGLHARPASTFSQAAKQYKSSVRLVANGITVNGKSVLSILTAGISRGTQVELMVEGEDAAEAINALVSLIESGCGEGRAAL